MQIKPRRNYKAYFISVLDYEERCQHSLHIIDPLDVLGMIAHPYICRAPYGVT